LLNVHGALDSLDNAGKLGQKPVSHELHDVAFVLRDPRLHQLSTEGLQALKRARFVHPHEAGVADHISGKNGGKATLHA
jgi:hypothetical protein